MSIKATIIIPTLNADKFLSRCLRSISLQTFPRENFEVFILDGGSTDKTLQIAESFKRKLPIKIIHNKAIDAESGKRLGISQANGDVIVLLDADNQIIGAHWLWTGIKVLSDHAIVWGVESPWLVNPKDSLLNQYFSMLKITDPVARIFSPSPLSMKVQSYDSYKVISVPLNATPVIGANGFFYRKSHVTKEITKTQKFEEVNYVAQLISEGLTTYAQLSNSGIFHYYCDNIFSYIKKRKKIAGKFLTRKSINQKTWIDKVGPFKFIISVLYNISFIGPFVESLYYFFNTNNISWFYHPFVSLITVCSYSFYYVKYRYFKNGS